VAGTVDTTTPGTYHLFYTASDGNGNTATNTRTVIVQDTTPPVVTLIGPSTITNSAGSTFTDPGATASDACAGPLAVITSGTVNTSVAGTYVINYIATDLANNSATNSRTVKVVGLGQCNITGGRMMFSGNFQLTFTGPVGQSYHVISSPSLKNPNWL